MNSSCRHAGAHALTEAAVRNTLTGHKKWFVILCYRSCAPSLQSSVMAPRLTTMLMMMTSCSCKGDGKKIHFPPYRHKWWPLWKLFLSHSPTHMNHISVQRNDKLHAYFTTRGNHFQHRHPDAWAWIFSMLFSGVALLVLHWIASVIWVTDSPNASPTWQSFGGTDVQISIPRS